MGLAPGVLPGRVALDDGGQWYRDGGWPSLPAARGLDATGILQAAAAGRIDVPVLLGADPHTAFPDPDLATRALAAARPVLHDDQSPRTHTAADHVPAPAAHAQAPATTPHRRGRHPP